ncbi:MAG: helix-hairpin-helix domain-containing protein [Reinekea sp.]
MLNKGYKGKEVMNKMFAAVLAAISLTVAMPVSAESTEAPMVTETTILYVDINNDSAEKMADLLKGIGLKKANAIVAYRKEHGPFSNVEDLIMVSGIGPSTLEKNRSALRIGDTEY